MGEHRTYIHSFPSLKHTHLQKCRHAHTRPGNIHTHTCSPLICEGTPNALTSADWKQKHALYVQPSGEEPSFWLLTDDVYPTFPGKSKLVYSKVHLTVRPLHTSMTFAPKICTFQHPPANSVSEHKRKKTKPAFHLYSLIWIAGTSRCSLCPTYKTKPPDLAIHPLSTPLHGVLMLVQTLKEYSRS